MNTIEHIESLVFFSYQGSIIRYIL